MDTAIKAVEHLRRCWASSLIRRAGKPPPSYGSPEWLALPEGSPAKVASVVVAAEAWAVDGDDIPERMRRDLADVRRAERHQDDELFTANVVPMVQALASRPDLGTTYAERRTRELADAMKPRPGDFPGIVSAAVCKGPGDAA